MSSQILTPEDTTVPDMDTLGALLKRKLLRRTRSILLQELKNSILVNRKVTSSCSSPQDGRKERLRVSLCSKPRREVVWLPWQNPQKNNYPPKRRRRTIIRWRRISRQNGYKATRMTSRSASKCGCQANY